MAVKAANQICRISASGGGSLAALPNESLLIKGIYSNPSANDTYLTLLLQGTTVGKFRNKGKAGNHVPYPGAFGTALYEAFPMPLFDFARMLGCPLDIPIAPGETLTLSRYAEAGDVTLLYDSCDPGDLSATKLNGSQARERNYLHYMTSSTALTSAVNLTLNSSLIWTGGPVWPIGGIAVPENTEFDVAAILASAMSCSTGTSSKGYTTALQLMMDNTVLFDRDRNGFPLLGDAAEAAGQSYKNVASVIGPQTREQSNPALILSPPLAFRAGERLTVTVACTGGATGGPAASTMDVVFLMRQKPAA